MSGRKKEDFNDVEFVDGDKPGKTAAEEEEEEAGEEDKLLIQHLKPTVHPSHKNYKSPAIEMRNPSDSSLNGESIEDVVNEHAELRDQHLNPDTVLLDMDNDSIPIDLTFFKIERKPRPGDEYDRCESYMEQEGVHDEGSDVFKTALTFMRYLLFIGRETKKEDQSRRRNHLRLALVILGLFLLIAELEISYIDWEYDGSSSSVLLDRRVWPQVLKAGITIDTLALILVTFDYYHIRKPRRQSTWGSWISTFPREYERKRKLRTLLLEVVICSIHSPPFFDVLTHGWWSDKIGLFMFLRLYIILRVLRDYSSIYTSRRRIMNSIGMSHVSPNFSTVLALKELFHIYPISFLTIWLLSSSLVMGYCIYIFERSVNDICPNKLINPDMLLQRRFLSTIQLAFQIMISGWATDTFDVVDPQTYGGKALSLACCVLGLFLFSLLIDFVHVRMIPTPLEEYAVDWVTNEKIKTREKNSAASVIQSIYRFYRFKKSLRTSFKTDTEVKMITKQCMRKYLQHVQEFHHARRQRIEYDKVEKRPSLTNEVEQQKEQHQQQKGSHQKEEQQQQNGRTQQLDSIEQRIGELEDKLGDISSKLDRLVTTTNQREASRQTEIANYLQQIEEKNALILRLLSEREPTR